MECSNDEARKAIENAENKMKTKDFEGARKLALKARQLYPRLEDISQLITVCNVHCSAEMKLNGTKYMDFYGILQIERFSDEDTIKKQYKKLALLLHPDKNRFPGAEAAFKLISEANTVLTDPAKRSLYDVKCRGPVIPATPKHVFHQSNKSFHAMKLKGNLNKDTLVPCSQHASSHTCQQLSGGNVSDRYVGSSIRLDARKKGSVGQSSKEDELKKGNANENGIGFKPPKKVSSEEVNGEGKSAKHLNGEEKELSVKKQKQVSFEELHGEGNEGNFKKKKRCLIEVVDREGVEVNMKKQKRLVNEEMNGEDKELILKKYQFLFSSLEAANLSKGAKDRAKVLFGLVGEEKLIELEQEWRILMQDKLELFVKEKDLIARQERRILMQAKLELFAKEKELIAKQLKLGLDAVKSQS